MKLGTKLGILFATLGSAFGALMYMNAVYSHLQAGTMSGAEAGAHCALASTVVGLTALFITHLSKNHGT